MKWQRGVPPPLCSVLLRNLNIAVSAGLFGGTAVHVNADIRLQICRAFRIMRMKESDRRKPAGGSKGR